MRLYQSRIEALEFPSAQPHAIGGTGPHVRQHDVRISRNSLGNLLPFCRLGVRGHRPLVGVQVKEVLHTCGSGYISVWRLELDYVGAQVAKALACSRSCDHIRHLHHSHAVEGWSIIAQFSIARLRQLDIRNLRQNALGMLSAHRARTANLSGRASELDRITHLRDFAEDWIAELQQHVVGDYLWILHRIVGGACASIWHIRVLENALPLSTGLGPQDVRDDIKKLCTRLLALRTPTVTVAWVGKQFGDPHHCGGNIHEAAVYAPDLNPIAVRTLEYAVKWSAACRRELERTLLQTLAYDLGCEHHRARHHGSVHLAPMPRLLASVQRRSNSLGSEHRCSKIDDRMHDMYRSRAESGL